MRSPLSAGACDRAVRHALPYDAERSRHSVYGGLIASERVQAYLVFVGAVNDEIVGVGDRKGRFIASSVLLRRLILIRCYSRERDGSEGFVFRELRGDLWASSVAQLQHINGER